MVDLANDVAFEAADDVAFALALGGPARDVSKRGLVEPHPDDHGPIDRGVELSVPSVIDAVLPTGHSRAGRDGANAGEFRERCFALDAFGVVSGDDEDLRCGVDTDTELIQQMRGALEDEVLDLCLELLDLLVQGDPASGDGS